MVMLTTAALRKQKIRPQVVISGRPFKLGNFTLYLRQNAPHCQKELAQVIATQYWLVRNGGK